MSKSETLHVKGSMRRISIGGSTIEDNALAVLNIRGQDYEPDNHKDAVTQVLALDDVKIIIINDELYYVDYRKINPLDEIAEISVLRRGVYAFEFRYNEGGASFEEMAASTFALSDDIALFEEHDIHAADCRCGC